MSQPIDSEWRTIWIVDAHRGDEKRYVVRADEKVTAFLKCKSGTKCALFGAESDHLLSVKLFYLREYSIRCHTIESLARAALILALALCRH